MQALIDQDLVCFRCAASAENDDFGIAKYRASELFDQILEKTGASSYRAFLTGTTNFRKKIYPEYKANRTAPKPRHLEDLRAWSVAELNAEVADEDLEADDMLGIFQTDDTIICSLDKDLLQIPGRHFSWEINGKGWTRPDTFVEQTELEGLRLFYEQCIKGDRSDNIKGIDGLGDKKAKILLEGANTEKEMLNRVLNAYGNEEEFLMNASCLWILRNDRLKYKDHYANIQK
jgi:DNA polymerase-1